MMRVVGYCRVSTDLQAAEGVSLAAQRDKIEQYCTLHDLELKAIATDFGESGKTLDRPGLRGVLVWLDGLEAAGLVVYKLDRLTRNLSDWTSLIERYFGPRRPYALMSVCESIDTRTAAGRMVLNIMMTVAQWEREAIVERTVAAVEHKRSRGERIGQVPYGKRLGADGRTLHDDPGERALLGRIRDYRAAGCSLREIAFALNAARVPTKNGKPWHHGTIDHLIKKGKHEHREQEEERAAGGAGDLRPAP